jgi:hypothetical protein
MPLNLASRSLRLGAFSGKLDRVFWAGGNAKAASLTVVSTDCVSLPVAVKKRLDPRDDRKAISSSLVN